MKGPGGRTYKGLYPDAIIPWPYLAAPFRVTSDPTGRFPAMIIPLEFIDTSLTGDCRLFHIVSLRDLRDPPVPQVCKPEVLVKDSYMK